MNIVESARICESLAMTAAITQAPSRPPATTARSPRPACRITSSPAARARSWSRSGWASPGPAEASDAPRLELRFDGRHVPRRIGCHAEKDRRQPDGDHAERIQDDRLLEMAETPRREAEDADVRKRDRRQRDERVAEEKSGEIRSRVRSDAVAGDAARVSIAGPKPPMPEPTTVTAIAPKRRNRHVWSVFTHAVPRMPAEEDVAHHHHRHNRRHPASTARARR